METFDRLVRGAEAARIVAEGDYTAEGILYCGKCKTPKQTKITVFGEERTVYCLCKCEAARRKAEDEAHEREQERRRIRDLRLWGFPDEEMQQWTFAKDDKANTKLSSWARCYVDGFDAMYRKGRGVVLYGPVGTGKTFAAACVANALVDKGRAVLMTSFTRINNILSAERNKQEYLDELGRYDLIVIDDLGTERDDAQGRMAELVFTVIDARYRQHKPLIITTNLTADELKYAAEVKYQRIYSRLYEMCAFMEVKGTDRREEMNAENQEEAADMQEGEMF
jgi:DNA replication protein DnaC